MQVFRLVIPGQVDRVLAFDELPKNLVKGVRRCSAEGFPRHWRDFLGLDSKSPKDAPAFYFLEHTMLNADKERWQEISGYVRKATSKSVRLLDRLEDMATPLAPDSYSQMTLEPEDVRVIPIAIERPEKEEIKNDEPSIEEAASLPKAEEAAVPAPKRRGRPRKEVVAA